MLQSSRTARQPHREAWPLQRLIHERALALGHTLEPSTIENYSSALNSYLAFVRLHNFAPEPTEDTLSFYVVYMSRHISPRSVSTYLSGIAQQLEPFFPSTRVIRNSKLVQKTLQGCLKLYSIPTTRKQPLAVHHLLSMIDHCRAANPSHDDLLFVAILLTGFSALLRLGELVFPDSQSLRDWRKVTRRSSLRYTATQYEFTLPFHKADRLYAGNQILIRENPTLLPVQHFGDYLRSRDTLFPLHSALFVCASGSVPSRSFFLRRMHLFVDDAFGGQSMRAGGATWLAERGVSPSLIQAMGRWSSDAFLIYIRKNPALLVSLVHGAP